MGSENGEANVIKGACFRNEKMINADELLEAQAHVWNHIFSFINSMSLKCAIQLGIPDIIHNHGKPMTLSDLVSSLPIHPTKTRHVPRLMRILSHSGFFSEQKNGHGQQGYVLTLSSRLLLRDNPFSVTPFVLSMLDPDTMKPWQYLTTWFRNDEPTPFGTTHGVSVWDYAGQHLTFSSFFDEAMASDARLVVSVVIDKYKEVFEGLSTLVDVGGGTGTMAKGIADAFPDLECIVLDLPHVVDGLEGTKNLRFVGGDMFEAVPPANAILLKWILHDWNDEECMKILEKCKEAIMSGGAKGGKVIIIDMVVEDRKRDDESVETQLFLDMAMMVLVTGKERNEKEWAELFTNAGFSHYKISPILGLRSLIEVYP